MLSVYVWNDWYIYLGNSKNILAVYFTKVIIEYIELKDRATPVVHMSICPLYNM